MSIINNYRQEEEMINLLRQTNKKTKFLPGGSELPRPLSWQPTLQ